jgi:sugar lactone lactonase YvrE
VVTDAGNGRILVLERDGTLRRAFGGKCDLAQAEASGCKDPDGPGPLALGDGQLNEPWGVAVAPNGDIYVADTWNHRVQRFDPTGRFLGKWGRFDNAPVTGATAGAEPFFYGPRGISIGLDGDLLVTDTGNKRLLRFSLAGEYLGALGSGGVSAEQWNEPVGIAPDTNGTLLVADTWNQRVKRLDRRFAAISTWRVPDWRSEAVTDKPFLDVEDGGTVFAGDPAGGRVWMFEPSGRLIGTLVLPALPSGTPRPLGIAIDDETRELLVIDHAGGRLLVFPLPTIETRPLQS